MNLLILASSILFAVWLAVRLQMQKKSEKAFRKTYWQKEADANSVRRKPLDSLHYITIPLAGLPLSVCNDSEQIQECVCTIRTLSEKKLVNLNNMSNTDLKLTYGAPNLSLLSEYDDNYTLLISTLQRWAALLYENHQTDAARSILEYAVSIGSDISGSYKLLAVIYKERQEEDNISDLIRTAAKLSSPMQSVIVRTLQESCL